MVILPIFTLRYFISGVIGSVVIQIGLWAVDWAYRALNWFTLDLQLAIFSWLGAFLASYFFAYFYERIDIGEYSVRQSTLRFALYMFFLVSAVRLPLYNSPDSAVLHWLDTSFVIGFLPCLLIIPFLHIYARRFT